MAPPLAGGGLIPHPPRGDLSARTYRDIAIEQMLGTVEEAMSQVIDWWGDLPPPMKEAIEQFRNQLGRQLIP